MVSTQNLAKITRFCSTSSKSAPSPPLQRGDIYCLSSFIGRAEQWYKEEVGRQISLGYREASSAGTRRQPSRTVKDKFHTCDYILHKTEVNALLQARGNDKTGGSSTKNGESRLPTPPNEKTQVDLQDWDPEIGVRHFRTRLRRAVQDKARGLRSRYDPEGIKHLCIVADLDWDCVDEEYCGHGLVDKCMKWIPKKVDHLKPRMKVNMEEFFSSKTANNHPERLKDLKKYRYSMLKKATLEKLEALEAAVGSHPEAMMEAEMLESPTLGRWPGTPGFLKEDIKVQTLEFVGLAFAVDVCLGEARIMML